MQRARFGHGPWFADPGYRCLEVVRVTADDVINDPKAEWLKTNSLITLMGSVGQAPRQGTVDSAVFTSWSLEHQLPDE